MSDLTPYQLLGEERIRQVAAEFYRVMDELPEAQTIRAMHGADLTNITDKLGDYLVGWMGGPPVFLEKYGTICLSHSHAPFPIGASESEAWLHCFKTALQRCGVSEEVQTMLEGPITYMAQSMENQDDEDNRQTA